MKTKPWTLSHLTLVASLLLEEILKLALLKEEQQAEGITDSEGQVRLVKKPNRIWGMVVHPKQTRRMAIDPNQM